MVYWNTLIPVIPVQLGESTTFTCDLSNTYISRVEVSWYKQSVGDNLKLIVNLREHTTPQFAPEFPNSRWKVNIHDNFTNLTILKTIQEDEGIYHCAVIERFVFSKWTTFIMFCKRKSCLSHILHSSDFTQKVLNIWPNVIDLCR
uniref:Ig-like domain-containing protein n=1 Tax=Stegastes partitus TaxID=144197 RepID=A0A3B4ZDZ1_9TELE